MPTLLSPAALWALMALALPLALHLWRPPPRTVRLGSLRFLPSSARRPLRNLRWRERLLLLARLSLLVLLALWLAGLRWQRPPSIRPERWTLLDSSAPPSGPSLDHLHALQRAGYQTRLLPPATDLWSLLREYDAALPPGSTVAVFSPNWLASLRGVRPSLSHCEVEWVQTFVSPTDTKPVVDPTPNVLPALNIVVYHDSGRAEDARYVRAALDAVAKITGRPFNVSFSPSTESFPFTANADWVIWLCAEPPPLPLAARTKNLLSEIVAVPETNIADWIVPVPNTSVSVALSTPVRLWRRGMVPPGAAVWQDANGAPLLTVTHNVQLTSWIFASRFHPDWTDLPDTTAFPAFLRSLLLPTTDSPFYADASRDSRVADPEQFCPSMSHAAIAAEPTITSPAWNLRGALWLLAAAIFILERLSSSQRTAVVTTSRPRQPVLS